MSFKQFFRIAAFIAFIIFSFSAWAIKTRLYLESGEIVVDEQTKDLQVLTVRQYRSEIFLVSFREIPSPEEFRIMGNQGIEFYQYLPKNSYYVRFEPNFNPIQLRDLKIIAVTPLKPELKIHRDLKSAIPDYTFNESGKLLVMGYYFDYPGEGAFSELQQITGVKLERIQKQANRIYLTLSSEKLLEKVARFSSIYFIEPIDPPSFPENHTGRTLHRSNMLNQAYTGGNKYDGAGMRVGLHDDGIIGPHIDYSGRIITQFPTANNGNHGDHVAGTIMGAGNRDPLAMGMAPGAGLYVYGSSNNNYDSAVSHYNKYDVVIVSKSYSNGCNTGYTGLTRQLDRQIRENRSLMHVFSAGNDGNSDCGYGAGAGWGNITGGHKMGKNVIATGNLTKLDVIAGSSSRGPANDGRIKPDICAKGTQVHSTIEGNDYASYTGTSMACPGISGSLAQLYHAYKSFNNGQNPPSALMKGTLLNTADDLGNPGPDFIHGWGRVNLRKALEVIENNQYFVGTASTATNFYSISVPQNAEFLKIMVYWNDHEASTSATRALVNNLDMVVHDPSNTAYLPWVLDPTPNSTALNSNAVRAVDTLNNMEQVTIDNPASGTWSIDIIPTSIPQGPQEFFVVYEIDLNEIYLTYPNGGEGIAPGETEIIRWDAHGNTGTFTLEYTNDGGTTWNTIASNINASQRYYSWAIPNDVTSQAMVRVSRGSVSDESDAHFTIIGVPQNLSVDWVCPDSIKISWNSVNSNDGYSLYELGPKYMDSVGFTNNTSYVFKNKDPNEVFWFSVSANKGNQGKGRRAIAISTNSGVYDCPINNDGALAAVGGPIAGTYLACDPDINVSMYVKNPGQNKITGVPVFCSLNGSTSVSGILNDTLLPGDSTLLQLSGNLTPKLGLNNLVCYTLYPGDSNQYNDTVRTFFDYRAGTLVTPPWSDNFETQYRCGTAANCEATICRLSGGWVNDSTGVLDESDWRVDDQGTPSNGTGPSGDYNPGNISGNYIYTEASEGCIHKTIQLTTPCLDLTNAKEPKFYYAFHMSGADMGDLHIDILAEGTWKLDVIAPKSGNLGDFWRVDSVDLKPYAGMIVNIRFRGITGDGYRSDIAIDDVRLIDKYDFTTGVNHVPQLSQRVRIYPNPAQDILNISWENTEGNVAYKIMDLTGHIIEDKAISSAASGKTAIEINNLPSGVFLIYVSDDTGSFMEKVVKLK